MALSAEYILTLQQIKGIGTKTILKISENIIDKSLTIEDLLDFLKRAKIKKLPSLSLKELKDANVAANRIIEYSEKHNISMLSYYDDIFPENLRNAINENGKEDPPLLLWYRGDLSILKLPGLAVIGTREATPEGIIGGTYISSEFAKRGFNIISGLAIGCDTCGHIGALNVGGKTTAFLANGLDHESIYPTENQSLAEKIVDNGGLLLSEYSVSENVNRYQLVARDRLQAGLALATLVIQTGIKGGTMHAANTTLLAGKPLYVMKFKSDSVNNHEKCLGNATLVEKGAKYISGSDNIDAICKHIKDRKIIKASLF